MLPSKFLTAVVVALGLLAVVVVEATMSEEEIKKTMIDLSKDCKEQTKASDADVELMASKKYPTSHEGQCMVLCVQKQFGIIMEDKFEIDNFMGIIRMGIFDEVELAKFEKVANDCKDSFKKDGDHCVESVNLGKCMEAAAIKHGVKPPQ